MLGSRASAVERATRPLRLHSAKILVKGEPNVSYICSRYYRAPELIFGATDYTCCIDTWSAGCVLAELLLGVPLFPGESGVDQLVEIIKVLGTPSLEEIQQMNQNYSEYKFPQVKPHPWTKVFRPRTPTDAIDLVSKFLRYAPESRLKPLEGCALPLFDELRDQNLKLPNNLPPPPLFDVRCSRKNARENALLTRCPHRRALPRSDWCVLPVACALSSRRRSSSSTHPHSKPSSSPHGTARLTSHARTRAKREQCIGERTVAHRRARGAAGKARVGQQRSHRSWGGRATRSQYEGPRSVAAAAAAVATCRATWSIRSAPRCLGSFAGYARLARVWTEGRGVEPLNVIRVQQPEDTRTRLTLNAPRRQ